MANHSTKKRLSKLRVRRRVKIAAGNKPRLCVHRTSKHIYAQVVDVNGNVLASASTLTKDLREKLKKTSTVGAAKAVGEVLAKAAKKNKVGAVVFDRSGYRYHGRVKALAEGARAGGMAF